MDINLDKHSPVPLGDQLQAHIRVRVIMGELAPGDLLPTVQALSAATDTNYNTVAAAYRALETQGYLVQRRRAGTRVAAQPPMSAQEVLAVHLSAEVAERIRALGLATNNTLQLIGAHTATKAATAERAPRVAVLAEGAAQAASLAERAEALFGRALNFVPATLTSYRGQNYAATLIAPALLESLITPRERLPYTPMWPNTYDFPAGAD